MNRSFTYRFLFWLSFSLKVSFSAEAQALPLDSLSVPFNRFQAQAPREKIFLHVDKSFYLAGESMWFKIYDVEADLLRPINISSICYVELLGKMNKPVLQAPIRLLNGKGNGYFILPPGIPSGYYTIRAYTSWMKNFSPDFYFHQKITVINTLSETTPSLTPPARKYWVRFFPEGGHLVYGLKTRMGIKALDEQGKGSDCRGFILNQNKDTVSQFRTTRFGMGNFYFTPRKGDSYQAIAEVGNTRLPVNLPALEEEGYNLQLQQSEGNKLKVVVQANAPNANPIIYLFIHSGQQVKNLQMNILINNQATFNVDANVLGEGLSHFTLFTSDRVPVCERLFFNYPEKSINIGLSGVSQEYERRQKVELTLNTMSHEGIPVNTDLSLSVFLLDSLQSLPQENIQNWFLLGSELKGPVESPEYYFGNTDSQALQDLDNLLLTQGWSRFSWDEVFNHKKPYFEFLPEPAGPIINGKISDRRTGHAPAPTLAYLSVPGKYYKFNAAISTPQGDIHFNLPPYWGSSEIIVQTNNQKDSNSRIDIVSPYSDQFVADTLPEVKIQPELRHSLLYRSINTQVESTFRINEKMQFGRRSEVDTIPFYGKPTLQYYLDDYTRFNTLEEVMKEYVEDVRVRKQSGKYFFRVRNDLFNIFFDDDPLLLLDGMPVFDPDKLMMLDPLKIRKTEVLSRKYFSGPLISDGIVSFSTYEGDLGGITLDPNTVALQYNGLQQDREFYSPPYDKEASRESPLPDFRNQLQWVPDIHSGPEGKSSISFFTSDLSGEFVIVVQGMTDKGQLGYQKIRFRVKGK